MSNREFEALFPRRETGFESPYDSVGLEFDFPVDDWDVLSDEQGKEVETDGRASKAD